MTEQIFSNDFTIKFSDNNYEKDFKNKNKHHAIMFSFWVSLILFFLSLICSILFILSDNTIIYGELGLKTDLKHTFWLIYLITFLFFANTIINIFVKHNITFKKVCCYFNYYGILFIFFYYGIYIFLNSNKNPFLYIYFVLFVEFIIRLAIILFQMIDFIESLILNIFIAGTVWLLVYYFEMLNLTIQINIFHNLKLFLVSGYAYFYSKQIRRAFYFNEKEKEQIIWYKSIIEKMNSGFILVKNNKIEIMNRIILDFFINNLYFAKLINKNSSQENLLKKENIINSNLKKISSNNGFFKVNGNIYHENLTNGNVRTICNDNENEFLNKRLQESNILEKDRTQEINLIKGNSEQILKTLFDGIEYSELVITRMKQESQNENVVFDDRLNSEIFMNFLKNKILKYNEFLFIGTKAIKNFPEVGEINRENNSINRNNSKIESRNNNSSYEDEKFFFFELNIRYYKKQEDELFEIILNDVSRAKLNEKRNTEFKYKTVLLSKIAH